MNSWLLASSVLGLLAIAGAEILRIKKRVSNEVSRKTLHIAHGLVVVSWAFMVGYEFIVIAELLFLVVVLLARQYQIMQPMRNVDRKSWGEIFFGIGVIATALMAPTREIFIAAILHLALADAFAALIGRKFKRGVYYVFGQRKTVAGSSAFFIISSLIILWLVQFSTADYELSRLLIVPFATTLAENFSPYGSDNLTIALTVLAILTAIA